MEMKLTSLAVDQECVMAHPPSDGPELATAQFSIEGDGWRFEGRATVPAGPTRVDDLLPLARAISDRIVCETSAAVEAAGRRVSCRKGCGACCRTLVAVSEVEARRIRTLVDGLPEPRRAEVRARFADAARRLDEAGLLEPLRRPDRMTAREYEDIMSPYFRLGIACPFLEDESCSIYAERPITCREFLVTSPPAHCAEVDSRDVVRVRLPLRVFNAVARWNVPAQGQVNERWVPLILAPEWVETHPEVPPPRPGPELLGELMRLLSVRDST
jgi:Fe-S-cluster containining protein